MYHFDIYIYIYIYIYIFLLNIKNNGNFYIKYRNSYIRFDFNKVVTKKNC